MAPPRKKREKKKSIRSESIADIESEKTNLTQPQQSKPVLPGLDFDSDIWNEVIVDDSTFDRKEAEEYVKTRDRERRLPPNPAVSYLDDTVFPLLRDAVVEMLQKVKDDNSFYHRKTTLDGLDCMAEILYNKNPNHPERQDNWTYIFDMEWAKRYLEENPRPSFPFHLIWSEHFAALKIQSFMRGYKVRCRTDVQELRQFWMTLRGERG